MNREDQDTGHESELNAQAFLDVVNQFIDMANRQNRAVKATDLHMAFLYAASRYNAYVAKSVLEIEDHEEFVQHMVTQYSEMLRTHMADDALASGVG